MSRAVHIVSSINPILAGNPVDLGLGGFLATVEEVENAEMQNGKFKVPTLRNVGLTAPYVP
jgi:cytochrome c peroxidase